MKRSVMRLLFAALSVGLTTGQGMAAQSTRDSVQGVWRVVEATARHYSRVEVQADGPRPVLADVAKASADELRAV
jgi:hypothetical protein